NVPDVDLVVTSKDVNLKDTIRFLCESYLYPDNYPSLSFLYNIASKHDLYFKYKAKSIDFVTDKAYAKLNFIPDNTQSPLKAEKGTVVMDKATVYINDVVANLFDSKIKVFGNVQKIDTLNPIYNLNVVNKNFNLANLNNIEKLEIVPEQLKKILAEFINYDGIADINIALNKNIMNGEISVKKFSAINKQTKTPLNFDNFYVYLKNNNIFINNVAGTIADMPIFANMEIANALKIPHINGYLTAKLTDSFVKTYLPKNIADKFTIKGDVNFSTQVSGNLNDLRIKPVLTMNEGSECVYNGLSMGDVNEKREFSGDISLTPQNINVKKFDYIKYISSQNNKIYPMVFTTVSGLFKAHNKIYLPENVRFKTNKNISAKFLNMLFQTTIFTQGTINGDIKYIVQDNGAGKVIGELNANSLDMPGLEASIKNIKLNADNNHINLEMIGLLSDSRVKMNADLKNEISTTPQINSMELIIDYLDNNTLFKNLAKLQKNLPQKADNKKMYQKFDLTGISVQNAYLLIKEIKIRDLVANNLEAKFNISPDGMLSAKDFKVNIAQGYIEGEATYNFSNPELKSLFNVNNVDANYIAENLFGGKNQIFGNANGKVYLSSKGTTNEEFVKNLQGGVFFTIVDGKMPKLGSLEYLLRAGNIIKNGITGFSLNSILEVLNLVKTGYFSSITGECRIENGIARDIEIFSQGENMSLYIHGDFDLAKTTANLEILGSLSKRISTFLGAIGNASLNTFFKLIPGISLFDFGRKDIVENLEKIPPFTNGRYDARHFQAIINGNINESNYVQSFRWIQ
ncbi:hypothetical protein II906_04920, partial [bacterium]|nr:hypothetical protein [bacterium]